ncbi:signal transduction protein [Lentzea sp. NBRC 105346]|uniref:EAL domain-containing protein n=1 Tax=Lentzea sp. NBRC 105346 TaxID=3032205 RepID=UPI0024A24CAE|nr:EAL domain-containing protein [Lentzea sp. NBRC 105346]GLZ34417.1 signal transduction protein [Lentzea sp. NBRC 105346]
MPRQDGMTPRGRDELAREWAVLLSATAYVPFSTAKLIKQLRSLLDVLCEAMRGDAEKAAQVGTRLVELHCVGATSLRTTIDVLSKFLPYQPDLAGIENLAERVGLVIGALAAGYTDKMQAFVLEQQESVSQALVRANKSAQLNLKVSEAQFEELFTYSASGIAIMDLTGNVQRANAALGRILHREVEDFPGLTLADLVQSQDLPLVEIALTELREGGKHRAEERPRMIDGDGESVRVVLAATLQRDVDDVPVRYVLMIDDDSQLTLLGGQLQYQSLHDPLTGLPNRQYLTTRMESLMHAEPEHGVTLYHLDLDAFSVITDGLGRQIGDRVLRIVAERLSTVFAEEKAMVSRLEGDEFAVLVENSATTPDVNTIISRIDHELSEAVFIDGHGVAVSATIGVLPRLPINTTPAEILRTSDMTLRRAKRSGRRQWGLHDATADKREQQEFGLAAVMPGAWESGEISVVYQPVVALGDQSTVCVEAELHWAHRDAGVIPHDKCVAMAEHTGLMLPLGEWVLRQAAAEAVPHSGMLAVCLTESMANNPDLVRDVRKVLDDTGLPASRLLLGFPVHVLASDNGEAVDNLEMIADLGCAIGARDFTGSSTEVELVRALGVKAVRIKGRTVRPDPLITHVLQDLVRFVHAAGGLVVIDPVETEEQADWWRWIGADACVGPLYCPEPGDSWPV